MRLQTALLVGERRKLEVHLAAKGLDPNAFKFQLEMEQVSRLAHIQKLEALQTQLDVADRMSNLGQSLGLEPKGWTSFILSSILRLPDDLIQTLLTNDEQPGQGEDPAGSEVVSSLSVSDRIRARALANDMIKEDGLLQQKLGMFADFGVLWNTSHGRARHLVKDRLPEVHVPEEVLLAGFNATKNGHKRNEAGRLS